MKTGQQGFTLIEVMIVTVIIAILATIAVPSYKDYVRRAHRSEGQNLLMQVAARQEQYYMNNKTYTDDMTNLGYAVDANGKVDTPEGYYKVDATSADATGFALSAAPQGDQSSDSCGTLTLDSEGTKSAATNNCW